MRSRVPDASARGPARLEGWRLATNKPGADGTAKANLVSDTGAQVWGVLWAIDDAGFAALDRAERGYLRVAVEVATQAGVARASTYVWTARTEDAAPSRAYKAFLVEGAREHGLPEEWQRRLAALPECAATAAKAARGGPRR